MFCLFQHSQQSQHRIMNVIRRQMFLSSFIVNRILYAQSRRYRQWQMPLSIGNIHQWIKYHTVFLYETNVNIYIDLQ